MIKLACDILPQDTGAASSLSSLGVVNLNPYITMQRCRGGGGLLFIPFEFTSIVHLRIGYRFPWTGYRFRRLELAMDRDY